MSVARILAAATLCGLALFVVPAGAAPPDCHGSNEEECREDPQPDHGVDCERSDDHQCATTTTTAEAGTTTTTATAETSTTATAAETTTTTTAMAAVVSTPTPAPVATPPAVVLSDTQVRTLPVTGTNPAGAVAFALLAIVLGVLAVYVSRPAAGR